MHDDEIPDDATLVYTISKPRQIKFYSLIPHLYPSPQTSEGVDRQLVTVLKSNLQKAVR